MPLHASLAVEREPSVSIVIATREPAPQLARVIACLLGQRYGGSVEVVAVVDGPLDSAALPAPPSLTGTCRRALRTLRNAGPPGLPGARRTGRLAAHGEIVIDCGDRDEWPEGRLQRIVARAGGPSSTPLHLVPCP